MNPCKTLVVENNKSSLHILEKYLADHSDIVSISSVKGTVNESIDILLRERFDITILDINIPGGNCFDILSEVPRERFGEIIFYTEFGKFHIQDMVRAQAMDYFEKPLTKTQVDRVVLRIKQQFIKKKNLIKTVNLFTPDRGIRLSIEKDKILYMEYENEKWVYHFFESGGNYLSAIGFRKLTDQLDDLDERFVQCNKKYILNIDFLKKYKSDGEGGVIVYMPNDKEIVISRHFREAVEAKRPLGLNK